MASPSMFGNVRSRAVGLVQQLWDRAHAIKAMQTISLPSVGMKERLTEGNKLINRFTGYDHCEALRKSVLEADAHFQSLREALSTSRHAFTKAIQQRSTCQKELNSLLQRKPTWIDTDLQRFTELYRNEMRLEGEERQAKEANEELEVALDKAHTQLIGLMRERYQEEQLWSDKIRRLASFGSFGLMAFNLALFILLQTVIEPRKRQKFITEFERLVQTTRQEQSSATTTPSPVIPESESFGLTIAKDLLDAKGFLYGSAAVMLINLFILVNFK